MSKLLNHIRGFFKDFSLLEKLVFVAYALPIFLAVLSFFLGSIGALFFGPLADLGGLFWGLLTLIFAPVALFGVVGCGVLLKRAKKSGISPTSTWAFTGVVYGIPYFCVGLGFWGMAYIITS